MGASVCASGSHVWNGNIGTLIANAKKNPQNRYCCRWVENCGTALSSVQLDATASVPGTFVYSPAAGAIPPVGNDTLSVTFTPTDSTAYTHATATVTLVVNPFNPVPGIGSLSPASSSAGGAAFTLTVNGSAFQAASTAYWGTSALATQYVSPTQLTAQVPASDIDTAGIFTIAVQTPTPGGASNAFQFEVDSAGSNTPPNFTTITATVIPGSSASYPVKVPSAATNVAVTCLNLPNGAACSYSAAAGAVVITTLSTTPKGNYQIVVVFTETLPGSSTAMVFLPFLLLPLTLLRKRWAVRGFWYAACLALILSAGALVTGCGGGGGSTTTPPPPTHQVTSSGTVTLTVN